jgi:glycosyltransferase involved in cell wall biosynthesis
VDRRKNLDVVLLALEGLYASGRLRRKFVVAGRRASGAEELIHRVRHNPLRRERVVFFDSPSDLLVGQLLVVADLMVFSSWSEGYGLPVVEALQHGVPVMASNATSIPEVAGGLVNYFEPWDSGTLAEMLARFDSDEFYRADLGTRAAKFEPTGWEETLDDILWTNLAKLTVCSGSVRRETPWFGVSRLGGSFSDAFCRGSPHKKKQKKTCLRGAMILEGACRQIRLACGAPLIR